MLLLVKSHVFAGWIKCFCWLFLLVKSQVFAGQPVCVCTWNHSVFVIKSHFLPVKTAFLGVNNRHVYCLFRWFPDARRRSSWHPRLCSGRCGRPCAAPMVQRSARGAVGKPWFNRVSMGFHSDFMVSLSRNGDFIGFKWDFSWVSKGDLTWFKGFLMDLI